MKFKIKNSTYEVNVGNSLIVGGEKVVITHLNGGGTATIITEDLKESSINIVAHEWQFQRYKVGLNVLWDESRGDGIRLKHTLNSSKSGNFHSCRVTFRSMEQLLHFFNLVANPNQTTVDVPNFDLASITCINGVHNTMYFHNSKGLFEFREVILAQDRDEL